MSFVCTVLFDRQHLVAKNLAGRLHEALGHVIKAVNLIKSSALKDRLFQQLCEKNNEEFEKLVLHTEVRWLSKGKLKLFWLNLGRREFAQFPSLAVISTDLLDDDLAVYVDHLKQLRNDMDTRFSDLLQMTVPHWFVDPFIADVSEVDVTLQESLIELQNNTTAQARFKRGGHQKLWMNQDVYKKYPILWKDVKLLLLAFPRLTWLRLVSVG
ncbi:zinc finger MYM-type protein 6-like [Macrobrachium nipponense]|uniref:zinc finger MYM-type protein 6-like n=1 Tax=Macrobrachium nipponense TaxID=159736 RepID=UPI0030C86E22